MVTRETMHVLSRRGRVAGWVVAGMLVASAAMAGEHGTCQPVPALEFGPYDYRVAPPDKLLRVENYHFDTGVESLTKGKSSAYVGHDLEFTLRYFPNHFRALNAMVKLGLKQKTPTPTGTTETVDCWVSRAIQFRPDDGLMYLINGLWLVQRGMKAEAAEQMAKARELQVDSANYQYNLGLGLLMVDKPQQALEAAHKAYALGHPLPGLRNKLQRIGAWRPQPEPAPEDPRGTAAPPANTGANASGAAAAAPGAAATRAGE
ncbi:MAG TPA: hypothetical protein PLX21_09355 [Rhodocyclaceae bacterium]|nr:hypothetical protein [Rhodocyclaceae bacterium]